MFRSTSALSASSGAMSLRMAAGLGCAKSRSMTGNAMLLTQALRASCSSLRSRSAKAGGAVNTILRPRFF